MGEHYVLSLTTETGDYLELQDHLDDLSWEHAKMIAIAAGWELGSDEFIETHSELKTRYTHSGKFYSFLHYMALTVLRELMEQGVAVIHPVDSTIDQMRDRISELSAIILSSFVWLRASGPDYWIENDDWDARPEHDRSVDFIVARTGIVREGNNDND